MVIMARKDAATEKPKGNPPVYVARAKQSPDSDFMQTIGAAWSFNQGDGLVVTLHFIPTQWDGKLILVPPKEDG
jgi:hypothetical protein